MDMAPSPRERRPDNIRVSARLGFPLNALAEIIASLWRSWREFACTRGFNGGVAEEAAEDTRGRLRWGSPVTRAGGGLGDFHGGKSTGLHDSRL